MNISYTFPTFPRANVKNWPMHKHADKTNIIHEVVVDCIGE